MTVVEARPATDLAALGRAIIEMEPERRAAYLARVAPEQRFLVERAITAARIRAADWKATPATMAAYLTSGEVQLWPYVELIGRFFAGAWQPGACPHRQVWVPAQMGKTTLLGNWTPVWALDRNPRLRIMYVSYDADKAVEEAGKARDLAERYAHELNFSLRRDMRARGRWSTPEGGGLYAVGINGGISGYPADVLLLDDLFKNWRTAHSPTVRDFTWSIYLSSIRMRLQGGHCPILYATTRWHEDDPPARMLDQELASRAADRWEVLKLAARAEPPDPKAKHRVHREPDPLGRPPGAVIERRRFDEVEVAARAAGSAYLTSALEQQKPTAQEGGEVKRAWFRIRDTLPPAFDLEIAAWDLKLKDSEAGDFVAGGWWGRAGSANWLGDVYHGQWNQVTTENAIALCQVRHPRIRMHYLEAAGLQPEVTKALQKAHRDPPYEVSDEVAGELGMTEAERVKVNRIRRKGMGNLIGDPVKGDKSVRMRAVSGYIEGGSTYLFDAPWNDAYLAELAAFGPNAAHDDLADMTSLALAKLTTADATATAARGSTPKTQPNREAEPAMPSRPAPPPRPSPSRARVTRPGALRVPRSVPTSGR